MNYDDFEVGAGYGSMVFDLQPALIEDWRRLFPQAPARNGETTIPPGYVSIIAMRAYMQIISARPPGNVHGEQSFEIERLPAIGATVVTDLACVAKEIKRERRWLTFATRTRDEDGSPLFTGVMKIAWAK
ncbi:MAG TPA: hypothetical protein VIR38_14285 [Thalassobaculum sp.]